MTPILMVQWAFWGMLSLILLGLGVGSFLALIGEAIKTLRKPAPPDPGTPPDDRP